MYNVWQPQTNYTMPSYINSEYFQQIPMYTGVGVGIPLNYYSTPILNNQNQILNENNDKLNNVSNQIQTNCNIYKTQDKGNLLIKLPKQNAINNVLNDDKFQNNYCGTNYTLINDNQNHKNAIPINLNILKSQNHQSLVILISNKFKILESTQ